MQTIRGPRWTTFYGRRIFVNGGGAILRGGAQWMIGQKLESRSGLHIIKYSKGSKMSQSRYDKFLPVDTHLAAQSRPATAAAPGSAHPAALPKTRNAMNEEPPKPISRWKKWGGKYLGLNDDDMVVHGPLLGMTLAELMELAAKGDAAESRKPGEPQRYDDPDSEPYRPMNIWHTDVPQEVAKEARDLTLAHREIGKSMPYSRALAIATTRQQSRKLKYRKFRPSDKNLHAKTVDYVLRYRQQGISINMDIARRHVLLGMS